MLNRNKLKASLVFLKLLIFLIFLIPIVSKGQCTKCTNFEEALKAPKKVKTIMISSFLHCTRLDSVPVYIDTFINLENFYLTSHNINYLPREISNLKKLKELSFAECKLQFVTEFIFDMKQLEELILFYNEFTLEYKKELIIRLKKELPNTKIMIEDD